MSYTVMDYMQQSGELDRVEPSILRRLASFYNLARLPGNFSTMLANQDWDAIKEHYNNMNLSDIHLGEIRYVCDRLSRYLLENSLEVPEILEYMYELEKELCEYQNQALARYYEEHRRVTDQLVQDMEYHRRYGDPDRYEQLKTVDVEDYMDPYVVQQYHRYI